METRIIQDTDISGSGSTVFHWHNARLFYIGEGLCIHNSSSNLYLQVNFSEPVIVDAVAIHGDITHAILNKVTYKLYVGDGTNTTQIRGAVSICPIFICSIFIFFSTFNFSKACASKVIFIKIEYTAHIPHPHLKSRSGETIKFKLCTNIKQV